MRRSGYLPGTDSVCVGLNKAAHKEGFSLRIDDKDFAVYVLPHSGRYISHSGFSVFLEVGRFVQKVRPAT
jgi:hypothetical protein